LVLASRESLFAFALIKNITVKLPSFQHLAWINEFIQIKQNVFLFQ
jgi:hypothetical protein